MPNIDPEAKRWESELAKRVGEAVAVRRKAIGWTAVQLAERTKMIGYPISRVAISKIENNTRAGKLDVAEVIALATALDIPPALLLFPDYPEGPVEYRPGAVANSFRSLRWFSGDGATPAEPAIVEGSPRPIIVVNDGHELVMAAESLNDLRRSRSRLIGSEEPDQEALAVMDEDIARHERRLEEAKARVWSSGAAWWEAHDEWSNDE